MNTQQDSIQSLLQDAERYLNDDVACTDVLGGNIQVGQVVSQSSASSSFNGQSQQSRIQLRAQVQGSNGNYGMLHLVANENGMEQLSLQLQDGRELNVRIPGGGAAPSPRRRGPPIGNRNDVVVDI